MNISLMKHIDSIVGRIAVFALSKSKQTNLQIEICSLLLIRPGGIGDAVLLSPAIRYFKALQPHVRVTVLAEKRNAGVFAMVPEVDRHLCFDRPGEFLGVLRGGYDVVIDTEQWHRLSAVVTRLVAAPVKIGFGTNDRRRMFTHYLQYSHDDYEADSFCRLLQPLGLDSGTECSPLPWLTVPGMAEEEVVGLLEEVGDGPFFTLFPGASIPERRWGVDRFRALAERLATLGVKCVVVGGREDRVQGEAIVRGGMNLAGRTSLAGTAAVIKRSSLLVSGDSGVLHIAVGLDVPTVSLFGPGRAKKWAPRGERHIVINKELSCSPCTTFGTTPPCPIAARCMKEITVDEVVNAVTMLLTSVGAMPSTCCKRDWIEAPLPS